MKGGITALHGLTTPQSKYIKLNMLLKSDTMNKVFY